MYTCVELDLSICGAACGVQREQNRYTSELALETGTCAANGRFMVADKRYVRLTYVDVKTCLWIEFLLSLPVVVL